MVTEADYTARYYRAHGAPHYYRKRELADRSVSELTLWCQVGKLTPELHRYEDVDTAPITPDSPFQVCHECRAELALVRTGRIS
ncbi:hypothetical protein [Amycolatopsis sp. H20-H5]|uniref:hypothetical protein n=1 Tax=Amycolatopsis sp. H20-H5 TaxID=3046309 RepID=UPI002DB5717A|nr:hypothetical protein [Amycolatopsis sp. H20-H5]MEC3974697.1 hypothetical protein [Amycolatopsis sp. H20-H5]